MQAASDAAARASGSSSALAVAVGFVGLLGVRVKQALVKKEAVAGERDAGAGAHPEEGADQDGPPDRRRSGCRASISPARSSRGATRTSASRRRGRLVRVGVAVGDMVKAGQVLAVLDTSRAAAQVGQAESQVAASQANLALAQDNLKRTEALVASKSIPEAQVEQARRRSRSRRRSSTARIASTRLAQTRRGPEQHHRAVPGHRHQGARRASARS